MAYIGRQPLTQAQRKVQNHNTVGGQSSITITGGYTIGFIDVILNGATLNSQDYTQDGSTIVFNDPLTAGDSVVTVTWSTFSIAGGTTGTFTAQSGETVTVVGGLVTDIS